MEYILFNIYFQIDNKLLVEVFMAFNFNVSSNWHLLLYSFVSILSSPQLSEFRKREERISIPEAREHLREIRREVRLSWWPEFRPSKRRSGPRARRRRRASRGSNISSPDSASETRGFRWCRQPEKFRPIKDFHFF